MNRYFAVIVSLLLCGIASPPLLADEGRIPLWQQITINPGQEGHYVVTRDISVPGGPVIDVQPGVRELEIDLNGFTLDTPGGSNVIQILGATRVVIRNGFLRSGDDCIQAFDTRELVVDDVHCQDPLDRGLHLQDVNIYDLRRNVIFGATHDGILVDNNPSQLAGQGQIEENQAWECGSGITLANQASFAVRDNTIQTTDESHGIRLETCWAGIVSGNTVLNTTHAGIVLEAAWVCSLVKNIVRDSRTDGIAILAASEDILVLENNSSSNNGNGLVVDGRRNFIDRNTLNMNSLSGVWFMNAASDNTYGRNILRGNITAASASCGVTPSGCVPPEVCDDGTANDSYLDNMAPGPPGC